MVYSPKKKLGIVAGSIVGLFLLAGIAGGHQQPTVNLTATPAGNITQTADQNNPTDLPQPVHAASPPASSSPPSATSNNDTNTGVTDSNLSNNNTYTNVDGTMVHSPANSTDGSVPPGATAQCGDGSYSFSQHRSGTCSHHGGVAIWL